MKYLKFFLIFLIFIKKYFFNMNVNNFKTFNVIMLNGLNEVPSNTSSAVGLAIFMYDLNNHVLSGVISFADVIPTASHIHKGAVGVDGVVIFPLATVVPIISPIYYISPALDSNQESDLLSNLYYVNIHSVLYPGGELRGQLIVK